MSDESGEPIDVEHLRRIVGESRAGLAEELVSSGPSDTVISRQEAISCLVGKPVTIKQGPSSTSKWKREWMEGGVCNGT